MKNITKHIPNFLTCCNIFCGILAITFPVWGLHLILLGAIFDFFDGFAARWLKSFSPIGKDLDSLADMLTFGAAPAVLLFNTGIYFALLLPVFSALRLAKFNIDTRQSQSFLGLPTPANGIFWAGIAYFFAEIPFFNFYGFYYIKIILNALICLFCFFMVSEIRMFSFKIKSKAFKNIIYHLILVFFIFSLVILFLIIDINILFSLPLIIIIYVFLSLIKHFTEPYEVYS